MLETLGFLSIQIVLLFVVTSVHTYLGLHVIRRGIVFSDLALDQLAAFGMIMGLCLGIQGGTPGSYLISMIAVLLGSVFLAYIKPSNPQIPHEAVIGILYGLALVASIMVADKFPGGSAYITQTLSGTMLWTNWTLVLITALVYALLSLFHWRYRKKFISLTEAGTQSEQNNFWDLLFFISLGIITVLIVPIAGVLLAYAFLMIPAATASLLTSDWNHALKIGWGAGFGASLAGLFASYYFRWPYGPTLVLALGVCFTAGLVIKWLSPSLSDKTGGAHV